MTPTTVTVELSVARVGSGGNTAQGQYFYSFNPANILIYEPDTQVILELSKDTADNFEIWRLVTSDNSNQLSDMVRSSGNRQLSFSNANSVEQLILVSVLVIDKANDGRIVNCDPQMINVPRGGIG
ncbi:MAG: hypothetical protein KDI51_20260 [Xanthomonadales bacterium]|nr:hypothetical protein [Xanthomonadales bacterium]